MAGSGEILGEGSNRQPRGVLRQEVVDFINPLLGCTMAIACNCYESKEFSSSQKGDDVVMGRSMGKKGI